MQRSETSWKTRVSKMSYLTKFEALNFFSGKTEESFHSPLEDCLNRLRRSKLVSQLEVAACEYYVSHSVQYTFTNAFLCTMVRLLSGKFNPLSLWLP